MQMKADKLSTLWKKLNLIKKNALFLGEMSEMHKKAISHVKKRVDELESDKRFLENMAEKSKNESKYLKN